VTHTETLRQLANEAAVTMPALGRKLHKLVQEMRTMEELMNELIEQARLDEFRHVLEETGVVILPVGVWGRA